jgi:hypothetical protein
VLHSLRFVARQHFRLDLLRRVQPDLTRNRLRGAPVVAGQHHHTQMLAVHLANCVGAALLDCVGHRQQPRYFAANSHSHHRLALILQPL